MFGRAGYPQDSHGARLCPQYPAALPLTCTPIRPIMMGMAHSRAQPGKTMPDNSLIDAQDRKPVVERKGHRSLRSEPECGQYHEG